MKIVVLDGYAVNPGDLSWDYLRALGDLTVYDRTPAADVISRIADAQIVILNKVLITREILEACPNIRLICVLATGYNVIDLDATRQRGITVCNVPAYSTAAVAQFTFALLLELCHRVGQHDTLVHSGAWSACQDFCFWATPQMELAGKTMGIIGFGRIGKAVAAIAKAMGMQVLAYSRTPDPAGSPLAAYTDLDTLLAQSDVVSLHCPLTPATNHLINAQTIAKMKDGALLLNTARGPVIDQQAVADALTQGKLRGVAMDVADQEPIPADAPLLTAPNCIITPHIAWAPLECRQRIMSITEASIRGFLSGQPVNTV